MKISFLCIGKTNAAYLKEGIALYEKRIKRYQSFDFLILADVKNGGKLSVNELKRKEGELLLKNFHPQDYIVLLDEKGKNFTSEQFSVQLQKWMNQHIRQLKFIVGGAYGFSPEVYARANTKIALSPMTFSHQMVRLIFTEQLYRAFSILNNEPYHHT